MELAREAGLDVQSIIKTVVENIRSHHIIDFSQNLEANIDTNITEVCMFLYVCSFHFWWTRNSNAI